MKAQESMTEVETALQPVGGMSGSFGVLPGWQRQFPSFAAALCSSIQLCLQILVHALGLAQIGGASIWLCLQDT